MEAAKECELMQKAENSISGTLDDRDFEVACDCLASHVGNLYAICDEEEPSNELVWICDLLYHISASFRKGYCLTEEETNKVITLGRKYDEYMIRSIVLPISDDIGTCFAHVCRAETRKIIVLLRKFNEIEELDTRLFDVFDSLANYFFGYAMYRSRDEERFLFKSRVY